jgi:hypothetical protein
MERTSAEGVVPPWAGAASAGFVLFLGVVFFLIVLFVAVLPEWRVNHDYVESHALVLDKRLAEGTDDNATTYRPEILIRYVVNDKTYQLWTYDTLRAYSTMRSSEERALAPFTVGAECTVWYDPARPEKAVVVRGYTWWMYLLLAVATVLALAGAVGLLRALRRSRAPLLEAADLPERA